VGGAGEVDVEGPEGSGQQRQERGVPNLEHPGPRPPARRHMRRRCGGARTQDSVVGCVFDGPPSYLWPCPPPGPPFSHSPGGWLAELECFPAANPSP